VLGAERLEIDHAPAPLRAQRLGPQRRVEVGLERLAACSGDEREPEPGSVTAESPEHLERVGRRQVEIVAPEKNRAVTRDALEDLPDDDEAQLGVVEHEALPGRADRIERAWRAGAEPLGGRGDPAEGVVVRRRDLPAGHQRLLDEEAVGPFEAEVAVHGAREAVERRRDPAVASPERHHHAVLVDLLAHPLREPALADAGFTDERDHPVTAHLRRRHLARRLHQPRALFVAPHHR